MANEGTVYLLHFERSPWHAVGGAEAGKGLIRRSLCAKSESQVSHAGDDSLSSKLGHTLSLAWLVGVADAGDFGAVGCLDVREGVADDG